MLENREYQQSLNEDVNPAIVREVGYGEAVIYSALVNEFKDQTAYFGFLEDGWFHCQETELAAQTEMTERYLRKKVRKLQRLGFIEKRKLYGENLNYYRLAV
ncbi:hypothetical protein SAMN05421781_0866 [Marinococcus luteus]|uniref:Helix-turn-helix domain-containing protein n=1 Tax=Marinococcus luteus TaxID=1122204 RepID=A0A1H2RQH0_9BACI|nr:hypothetical protein [Marinococcus luteus]SDW21528.1 hypothetical protein SAMN05421781_0866 [Marinococcus luteus]